MSLPSEKRKRVTMNCLSLDHRRADASLREKFAFSQRVRAELCARFQKYGGCVPIVTCNRTEVYFSCEQAVAEEFLYHFSGVRTTRFAFYAGDFCLNHLFELTAGLCSMVVGEDEILGQVKSCYEFARSLSATQGLDAPFQAALACGKRVRAETGISSLACSVATLAANAVFSFCEGKKRVLVVGASGKIGGSVLKNLAASEEVSLVATTRSHEFSAQAQGAESVPYEQRYLYLDEADCVVCATASPHVVFSAERVRTALRTRKKRLFIDLALPQDIDPAVGGIPDCSLADIDSFREAAQENNRKKVLAAAQAERIVRECVAEYFADEAARRHAEVLGALPEKERGALYALRKADPARFAEEAARLAEIKK